MTLTDKIHRVNNIYNDAHTVEASSSAISSPVKDTSVKGTSAVGKSTKPKVLVLDDVLKDPKYLNYFDTIRKSIPEQEFSEFFNKLKFMTDANIIERALSEKYKQVITDIQDALKSRTAAVAEEL